MTYFNTNEALILPRYTKKAWEEIYGQDDELSEMWEVLNQPNSITEFLAIQSKIIEETVQMTLGEFKAIKIVTIGEKFLHWLKERGFKKSSPNLLNVYANGLSDDDLNALLNESGMNKNYQVFAIHTDEVQEFSHYGVLSPKEKAKLQADLQAANPSTRLWVSRTLSFGADRTLASETKTLDAADSYFADGVGRFHYPDAPSVPIDGASLLVVTEGKPFPGAVVSEWTDEYELNVPAEVLEHLNSLLD